MAHVKRKKLLSCYYGYAVEERLLPFVSWTPMVSGEQFVL